MRMIRSVGALVLAAASVGGCATVTRGSHTAWRVESRPPGAEVKTSNGFGCESTPCEIKMPRKSMFTATVSKPGYRSVTVQVTNKVGVGGGAGMAGNVLAGGIIGAGVDVATGAMLDLTPNPYAVDLVKDDGAAAN